MAVGLLLGERPATHQLGHHGVVVGEAPKLAITHQIGARIAHVHHIHPAFVSQQAGGHGCAHPGPPGIASGGLADVLVCPIHGTLQVAGPWRERQCLERLHSHARGHLAGLGTTHTVGHRHDGRTHEMAVLVVAAHAAHVGGLSQFDQYEVRGHPAAAASRVTASTRASTTVTLSGPPALLARAISVDAASFRVPAPSMAARISSSSTGPD